MLRAIINQLKVVGIPSGTYYPVPLHLQGAFVNLGYKEGDFPVTEELSKTTFVLPVFPELKDEERNYIINCLKKVVKGELIEIRINRCWPHCSKSY